MKTGEYIRKLTTGKWIGMTVLTIVASVAFGYLYSRGVSFVWTVITITCFRGFFRFLYKVICFLVAVAILFRIPSYLVL